MVKVEKLTKKFGANTAVDSIDFEVQKARSSDSSAQMVRARAQR